MTAKPNVDELVTRALAPRYECWALVQDEFLQEFVRRLEEIEAQKKGSVNRTEVAQILRTHFGIDTSRGAVSRHLLGQCSHG